MAERVNVQLKENLSFEVNVDGHKLMIDSSPEAGGTNKGPKPKSLMMVALAGCTGMDVASILRKMKIAFDDLQIEVEGTLTETHPRHFEEMKIIYILKGKNIPYEKVEKAVNLSQEKYCGVSFSYRESMKISHEIRINDTKTD